MERKRNVRHLLYTDIGRKKRVEGPEQLSRFQARAGVEVGHLPESMYPGVRPPGRNHAGRLLDNGAKCLLNCPLHCEAVRLDLPTLVVGAVVRQHQLDIAHQTPALLTRLGLGERGSIFVRNPPV